MCGLQFVYSFVPSSVVQSQSKKPSQFVSVYSNSLLVVFLLLSAVVGVGELGDLGVSACVLGALTGCA